MPDVSIHSQESLTRYHHFCRNTPMHFRYPYTSMFACSFAAPYSCFSRGLHRQPHCFDDSQHHHTDKSTIAYPLWSHVACYLAASYCSKIYCTFLKQACTFGLPAISFLHSLFFWWYITAQFFLCFFVLPCSFATPFVLICSIILAETCNLHSRLANQSFDWKKVKWGTCSFLYSQASTNTTTTSSYSSLYKRTAYEYSCDKLQFWSSWPFLHYLYRHCTK